MIGTILIFLIVLLVLILAHEFGHFYTAKKTGMTVEEFGIGFPPRAASIKKGGTRYSLNWLPFGGFVKIKGENPEDPGAQEPGSFATKSKSARLLVLSAGVIMNMLLAWVLLTAALTIGTPQAVDPQMTAGEGISNERVYISDVAENSPAQQAGIKGGDIIVKIEDQPVNLLTNVQEMTSKYAGTEATYVIKRQGEELSFEVLVRENPPQGQGAIGVSLVQVADVSYPFLTAVWKGFESTWEYLKLTVVGFAQLIAKLFTGQQVDADVAGPVGIAVMTGRFAQMGLAALLQFAAILSINLAVINILPIPALDGGRIMFVLAEAIRGKKIDAKIEQWSHGIGFALLLVLMFVVIIRDIVKLL